MEAIAVAPSTGAAATVTASDQARIDAALEASRSANTTRAYRSGWVAWQRWATENGHQIMPAAPVAVAAYLTHRAEQGAAVATVRMARAAISAAHRQAGADDPCQHAGVRQVLAGIARTGQGQGRGQVQGLDWRGADLAAGIAANGGGSLAGRRDAAIIAVMSDALLRVSEAAALNVADVHRQVDGSGTVTVTSSKTDQDGRGHVRYLGAGTMQRIGAWLSGAGRVDGSGPLFRQVLKDGATATGRLGARSIRSIIAKRAADAGVAGRVSGHSLRVGSAQSLAAAGAGLVELQEAGDWQSPTMPAHYARHQLAARGAVAKLRYQAGR